MAKKKSEKKKGLKPPRVVNARLVGASPDKFDFGGGSDDCRETPEIRCRRTQRYEP